MQIGVAIPDQLISDLIITAIEQGCGYWASQAKFFDNSLEGKPTRSITDHPMYDLSSIIIVEAEGENGETEHTLRFSTIRTEFNSQHRVRDFTQIKRGLTDMAAKYPRHFANIISDDHDAETADVFLQCCILGDVVYG
jgi:hypothetical protein